MVNTGPSESERTRSDKPAKKAPAKKAPAKKAPAKKAVSKEAVSIASAGGATDKLFAKATKRAREVVRDPAKAQKLVGAAMRSAGRRGKDAPTLVIHQVRAMGRLVKASVSGEYRGIDREDLLLVIAGLVYVAWPVDAIPDFLPVGFLDDAAVISWVVSRVASELDEFEQWEQERAAP